MNLANYKNRAQNKGITKLLYSRRVLTSIITYF